MLRMCGVTWRVSWEIWKEQKSHPWCMQQSLKALSSQSGSLDTGDKDALSHEWGFLPSVGSYILLIAKMEPREQIQPSSVGGKGVHVSILSFWGMPFPSTSVFTEGTGQNCHLKGSPFVKALHTAARQAVCALRPQQTGE